MAREKGANEVFCRSCGEAIKMEAEICPECGVRNKAHQRRSGPASSDSRTSPVEGQNQSDHTTTVSANWRYAVVGAVAAWILLSILSLIPVTGSTVSALLGYLVIAAWILMPIGIYFDSDFVRSNADWNPRTTIWMLASVIPFANIVVGCVYLYRRRGVL